MEAGFLFGISFIGSLILTSLVRHYIKGKKYFDRMIVLAITIIVIMSFLGVIANIILTINSFGIKYMLREKKFCKW